MLIRYADDFVMGSPSEEDARRVMAVLPKRFGKYGLTIHPEKTRLVPFERPSGARDRANSEGRNPQGHSPVGIHPLLGPLSEGVLGGEAQDIQEPVPPWIEGYGGMVPGQSPLADG